MFIWTWTLLTLTMWVFFLHRRGYMFVIFMVVLLITQDHGGAEARSLSSPGCQPTSDQPPRPDDGPHGATAPEWNYFIGVLTDAADGPSRDSIDACVVPVHRHVTSVGYRRHRGGDAQPRTRRRARRAGQRASGGLDALEPRRRRPRALWAPPADPGGGGAGPPGVTREGGEGGCGGPLGVTPGRPFYDLPMWPYTACSGAD
mgnify:CR=1 FL=1